MKDDMKWVMIMLVVFLGVPLAGLGISTYRKQDCRIEMAKINKPVDDIKEICK